MTAVVVDLTARREEREHQRTWRRNAIESGWQQLVALAFGKKAIAARPGDQLTLPLFEASFGGRFVDAEIQARYGSVGRR